MFRVKAEVGDMVIGSSCELLQQASLALYEAPSTSEVVLQECDMPE